MFCIVVLWHLKASPYPGEMSERTEKGDVWNSFWRERPVHQGRGRGSRLCAEALVRWVTLPQSVSFHLQNRHIVPASQCSLKAKDYMQKITISLPDT